MHCKVYTALHYTMVYSIALYYIVSLFFLGEAFFKNSCFLLDIFQKGGGSKPNLKVLGCFFLGLLLDITEESGGVDPIPKPLW